MASSVNIDNSLLGSILESLVVSIFTDN